ncbi:MAG TPA: GyrI-like domain-containing protein [Candidatus Sulfotelmatobacter sp.]|jgi:AraC family transcriptional regulator|nr:GyrI-like domain-containing protein [Candidatus Sulfotelmatobacter sp.]
MSTTTATQMQSPRIENGRQMLLAGLGGRYNRQTMHTIPQLWERFGPHIGHVPNQSGKVTYGVSYNPQPDHSTFDYLAAVEVTKFAGLPTDFVQLTIPPLKYAIFLHTDHISKITETLEKMWKSWLPASGHAPAVASGCPITFFERYDESFNPITGLGTVELWLPIQP